MHSKRAAVSACSERDVEGHMVSFETQAQSSKRCMRHPRRDPSRCNACAKSMVTMRLRTSQGSSNNLRARD
eukprot:712857-Amphidinium_carterae.3